MARIAMSPRLTCYQLRTKRRFSRITSPATSHQTKRIRRSVRTTEFGIGNLIDEGAVR